MGELLPHEKSPIYGDFSFHTTRYIVDGGVCGAAGAGVVCGSVAGAGFFEYFIIDEDGWISSRADNYNPAASPHPIRACS
jgi:hypothetical protein